MPTPIDENDQVDFGAIERNVARWLLTPLSGFVLNSENGEESFLSLEERRQIIRTVNAARGDEKLIVAGIDQPSVVQTLKLAEAFALDGADLLRIRIPRLTPNVRGYFEEVIAKAPAPVMIIHQMAPGMFLSAAAGVGASAELLAELMSLENAWGYICSDNLRFEVLVGQLMPADKRYWAANGSLLLAGAATGANGACLMLGNVAPQACHDILRLTAAGELTAAQAIHQQITPLDWAILSRKAAGVKAAMTLLGYEIGPPRSPTPPCSAEVVEEIRQALINVQLL